jgi:hypothetical protein
VEYVAFYDRALAPDQVMWTFDHPPDTAHGEAERSAFGLLAAYDLAHEDGHADWTVHDSHGTRLGADIAGMDGTALTAAIARRNAFSVEIWRTVADRPPPPGILVGIYQSAFGGNFTIGDTGTDIFFRVRNGLTGPVGSRFTKRVTLASLPAPPTHIVASYEQGVSQIFTDAQGRGRSVDMREPSGLLRLGTGPVGQMVTAVLASLSLLLMSWRADRPVTMLTLMRLGAAGWLCLTLPVALGALISFSPARSMHYWFVPAFALSAAVLSGPGAVSRAYPFSGQTPSSAEG